MFPTFSPLATTCYIDNNPYGSGEEVCYYVADDPINDNPYTDYIPPDENIDPNNTDPTWIEISPDLLSSKQLLPMMLMVGGTVTIVYYRTRKSM